MKAGLLWTVGLLVLTGCVSAPTWKHDHGDEALLKRDTYDCTKG